MGAHDLGADDLAAVLGLVEELGECTDMHAFVTTAMRGLLEMVPSIDVSYNEMNPFAQRAYYDVWPRPDKEFLDTTLPLFRRHMRQNPLIAHMEATGDTRALMWSDFVTVADIKATDLYKGLYRQLGVVSQMAVTLPTPSGIVIGFALNRDDGGFDERDRAVMNTLRPHLVQAYRTVQLHGSVAMLQDALSATGWSAALVDSDAQVVSLTNGASEALATVDVDMAVGGELPSTIRDPFLHAVGRYDRAQPAVLSSPIRLSGAGHGVDGWYVPSPVPPHVVLVRACGDPDGSTLASLGLTEREIDVARALVDGGTNAQLAETLEISEGTVRKHLERVYRVLGVDNRTAAAARVRDLLG
ncbi:MAG: LuxR C-terminal-related transcriptional regulator [Actinomycetota bacterium]